MSHHCTEGRGVRTAGEGREAEGENVLLGKREGRIITLTALPRAGPEGRDLSAAIFPLGTICNYHHSSLIFNSFY